MNKALVLITLLILTGCTGGAQLYPANAKAKTLGAISLQYQASLTSGLMGTVSGQMPNGESLSGQYTSIDNRTQGFGSIYSSVYGTSTSSASAIGTGGSAIGTGMSNYSGSGSSSISTLITPQSRLGMVNVLGNQGTVIECEYVYNNSGGGIGACKTDKGALYKMQIR